MTQLADSNYRLKMTQLTMDNPYVAEPVHVYTFEVDGDLILFDAGPATEEAANYLRTHVDLGRIKYVFMTHCHADHHGLARFLADEVGAEIVVSRHDAYRSENVGDRGRQQAQLLAKLGFPEKVFESVLKTLAMNSTSAQPLPKGVHILEESEELLEKLGISYLNCPWHSQSDVVYLLDNYAISGDAILRGFFSTPLMEIDLTATDGRRFSNYAAFCQSIVTLSGIDNRIFLPGHRGSVGNVREWIQFSVNKILERTDKVAPFKQSGKNIYEMVESLYNRQLNDPFIAYLKASEVVFMYDFLSNPVLLYDALEKTGLSADFKFAFEGVASHCLDYS